MTSEVDICNLALASLGDTATVTSINPPEGSAQANHCARFYPVARDALLEWPGVQWNFATTTARLARFEEQDGQACFAYALPVDFIRALDLTGPDGGHAPFSVGLAGAARAILTKHEQACLVYVCRIEDTLMFPPLFVNALAHLLASMLAGPLIKGSEGEQTSKRCLAAMQQFLSVAVLSDAQQRRVETPWEAAWIRARR